MAYSHKPDISVKLSPRITKQAKQLIDRTCRRYDMFEADVLRFCLEAAVPIAAKRGMNWVIRQIPGFESNLNRDLGSMVTVRTSRPIKTMIAKLQNQDKKRWTGEIYSYTENEVVRYCYDYILPIAYREGFGRIMDMRQKLGDGR